MAIGIVDPDPASAGTSPSDPHGTHEARPDSVLLNGVGVSLRPLLPEDRQELLDAFAELSPESRYSRFFSPVNRLDNRMLRTLMDQVDERDHVARVMFALDGSDAQPLIAIGRFIRSRRLPHSAEIAVTVADDWQGQGAGRVLVRALADVAQEKQIRFFTATVLAGNPSAVRLMEHAGAIVERSSTGATVELRVDLQASRQPAG